MGWILIQNYSSAPIIPPMMSGFWSKLIKDFMLKGVTMKEKPNYPLSFIYNINSP